MTHGHGAGETQWHPVDEPHWAQSYLLDITIAAGALRMVAKIPIWVYQPVSFPLAAAAQLYPPYLPMSCTHCQLSKADFTFTYLNLRTLSSKLRLILSLSSKVKTIKVINLWMKFCHHLLSLMSFQPVWQKRKWSYFKGCFKCFWQLMSMGSKTTLDWTMLTFNAWIYLEVWNDMRVSKW